MLKFINNRSPNESRPLPADHDQRVRRAFGRYAEDRYKMDGIWTIVTYYGKDSCFQCDCSPNASLPPLLCFVNGKHLRREDKMGGKGTPHHDSCDFAYDSDEQKKLVQTWLPFTEQEHHLNLVPPFSEMNKPLSTEPIFISSQSRAPYLARVLFNLMHEAKTDRILPTSKFFRYYYSLNDFILKPALNFSVSPDKSLLDWIAISDIDVFELKRRLLAKPSGWDRPCGLFLGIFGEFKNKTLYYHRSKDSIQVSGDLYVYGERQNDRLSPYLVIGVLTLPTRDSEGVILHDAYAHPCFDLEGRMLVNNELDRSAISQLSRCSDWLSEHHGISVTIVKPLFDIGPTKISDGREVFKPDIILRCRLKNGKQMIVIIETIEFDDAAYRKHKRDRRALLEQIKGGSPPHKIISYDCFNSELTPYAFDQQFRKEVCFAISGEYPEDEEDE